MPYSPQSTSRLAYPVVETYDNLPNVITHVGEVFLVKLATGIIFINRRRSGLYISDGSEWTRMGRLVAAGEGSPSPGWLVSNPPIGMCVVTNVYVNPSTGKTTVEYNDELVT